MKTITLRRGGSILFQLLFWLVYGSLLYASLASWKYPQPVNWTSMLSDVTTSVLITYVNYLLLLPRLYGKGKYGRYIFASLAIIVVLITLRVTLIGMSHRSVSYTWFIRSLPIIGFYLVTCVIWFFKYIISARQREVELKNSQLDSELKFLKLQLSPHFLFNTLNNIYSLVYFQDANAAPAILKLSGMMRHMLHESQEPFISLIREITFMENFIELWRLKLDEKPTIVFNHSGVSEQHRVAPLIFLAFLENAFKHGNTINGSIVINLDATFENVIHFRVVNEILNVRSTLEEKSGVGLANVRKRLELIYPGKHQLDISVKPDLYEVNLKIQS